MEKFLNSSTETYNMALTCNQSNKIQRREFPEFTPTLAINPHLNSSHIIIYSILNALLFDKENPLLQLRIEGNVITKST
uniref:Uncharacterized protein n=1 Tax=Manihot esculenta TaxID=3983 RepID=A0A2C9U1X2_MANES